MCFTFWKPKSESWGCQQSQLTAPRPLVPFNPRPPRETHQGRSHWRGQGQLQAGVNPTFSCSPGLLRVRGQGSGPLCAVTGERRVLRTGDCKVGSGGALGDWPPNSGLLPLLPLATACFCGPGKTTGRIICVSLPTETRLQVVQAPGVLGQRSHPAAELLQHLGQDGLHRHLPPVRRPPSNHVAPAVAAASRFEPAPMLGLAGFPQQHVREPRGGGPYLPFGARKRSPSAVSSKVTAL